jgi:hypothetical protein
VNTVTHSYDTSAVLPQFLLDKDRQKPGRRFQVSTIFLFFFFCQILVSKFWLDRMFQASAPKIFGVLYED